MKIPVYLSFFVLCMPLLAFGSSYLTSAGQNPSLDYSISGNNDQQAEAARALLGLNFPYTERQLHAAFTNKGRSLQVQIQHARDTLNKTAEKLTELKKAHEYLKNLKEYSVESESKEEKDKKTASFILRIQSPFTRKDLDKAYLEKRDEVSRIFKNININSYRVSLQHQGKTKKEIDALVQKRLQVEKESYNRSLGRLKEAYDLLKRFTTTSKL